MPNTSHRLQPHLRSETFRADLAIALQLDRVTVDNLVEHMPHYRAREMVRLLADEIVDDDRWQPAAQAACQALLTTATTAQRTPSSDNRLLTAMPDADRPREKLQRLGSQSLTEAELIALLLRTGNSQQGVLEFATDLLHRHDGLLGLASLDSSELLAEPGLGNASPNCKPRSKLAAASARQRAATRPTLRQPEDVAAYLAIDLSPLAHEEFYCLPLDPRSRLIGEPRQVSRGDIDSTEAGPRNFYRIALKAGAATCIAVHNHPSGDPSPSAPDIAVTAQLIAAGNAIGCQLVDHIIIGDGGRYTSLRRQRPDLFV